MTTRFATFALIGISISVLLTGCAPKSGGPGAVPGPTNSATETSSSGTNGKSTSVATPNLPQSLIHDAYRYNGFGRVKPLTYLFSKYQGEKAIEGTQTIEFGKADQESATYSIKRGGSLDDLGTDEVLVKPDGIYIVSLKDAKPDTPKFQMPAKLDVGATWDYNVPMTRSNGSKLTLSGKSKVEAEEKIKVAAGEFDTIRVSDSATMAEGGKKGSVSMKTWYAKDIGIVKMKMEFKNGDSIVTSTMELTGKGD